MEESKWEGGDDWSKKTSKGDLSGQGSLSVSKGRSSCVSNKMR